MNSGVNFVILLIIFSRSAAFLSDVGRVKKVGQCVKSTKCFGTLTDSSEKDQVGNLALLFSRSTEIASTLSGLLFPLISSAISVAANIDTDNREEEIDAWDRYWLAESKGENNENISNADRLVCAVEHLGPTYVKVGQAVASRPDIIPKSLAASLSTLQDDMKAFDVGTAKQIIEQDLINANVDASKIAILLDNLSENPVAAASVGVVFKSFLPEEGQVAVKVQRPGLKAMVDKDAALLRNIALFVESIPSPTSNGRLIQTELVSAVDEFMSRIFEELDYPGKSDNINFEIIDTFLYAYILKLKEFSL